MTTTSEYLTHSSSAASSLKSGVYTVCCCPRSLESWNIDDYDQLVRGCWQLCLSKWPSYNPVRASFDFSLRCIFYEKYSALEEFFVIGQAKFLIVADETLKVIQLHYKVVSLVEYDQKQSEISNNQILTGDSWKLDSSIRHNNWFSCVLLGSNRKSIDFWLKTLAWYD